MSRLTRLAAYAAAFVLPPAIVGFLGLSTLHRRERPPILPTMGASSVAAIPRPDIDARRPTVVVVLGSDLTEITDALGPYEMFARTGRFNVVTASAERQPTLLTGGVRILPHYSLREVTEGLSGHRQSLSSPTFPTPHRWGIAPPSSGFVNRVSPAP